MEDVVQGGNVHPHGSHLRRLVDPVSLYAAHRDAFVHAVTMLLHGLVVIAVLSILDELIDITLDIFHRQPRGLERF